MKYFKKSGTKRVRSPGRTRGDTYDRAKIDNKRETLVVAMGGLGSTQRKGKSKTVDGGGKKGQCTGSGARWKDGDGWSGLDGHINPPHEGRKRWYARREGLQKTSSLPKEIDGPGIGGGGKPFCPDSPYWSIHTTTEIMRGLMKRGGKRKTHKSSKRGGVLRGKERPLPGRKRKV